MVADEHDVPLNDEDDCTTCKHEPAWEPEWMEIDGVRKGPIAYSGRCQAVPIFFTVDRLVMREDKVGIIIGNGFECIDRACNKWAAKCRDRWDTTSKRPDVMRTLNDTMGI